MATRCSLKNILGAANQLAATGAGSLGLTSRFRIRIILLMESDRVQGGAICAARRGECTDDMSARGQARKVFHTRIGQKVQPLRQTAPTNSRSLRPSINGSGRNSSLISRDATIASARALRLVLGADFRAAVRVRRNAARRRVCSVRDWGFILVSSFRAGSPASRKYWLGVSHGRAGSFRLQQGQISPGSM